VFDLDDTLYRARVRAVGLSGSRRWAAAELGIEGPGMTRLLDDGHLGKPSRSHAETPSHAGTAGRPRAYRNHEPQLLFEDAAWALSHFADKAKLGMIVDGTHEMQARKVAALRRRFQESSARSAGGSSQAASRELRRVERALGAGARRLVYVGDNPSGLRRAQPRGWVSVMVERPGHKRIHSAAEVADGSAPQPPLPRSPSCRPCWGF
jgi:FMN phosphatase YigB (HAD superfamily)